MPGISDRVRFETTVEGPRNSGLTRLTIRSQKTILAALRAPPVVRCGGRSENLAQNPVPPQVEIHVDE
jgi:hypothetical protein